MAFGRAFGDSDFQPRAVTEFRRAIEENPRLPGAHYLLGAVLLATDDSEGAETELKKELVVSPHDSIAYAALGKIAATHHDYPMAEAYLKKAILFGSHSPDAYLYLGQMYVDTNRSAEAETALRQCIRLTTRCFAESISGPEGTFSSWQNPDAERAAGCGTRGNEYRPESGQQNVGTGQKQAGWTDGYIGTRGCPNSCGRSWHNFYPSCHEGRSAGSSSG